MANKIGVIAGTPVDTQMGKEYFESSGHEVVGIPAAADAMQAFDFFGRDDEYKHSEMNRLIARVKEQDADRICIYCNALSAAVDVETLATENDIKIVTPFDAYKKIGSEYHIIADLAATAGALAAVEESIHQVNPDADIRGTHMLDLTVQIETGAPAPELIARAGLADYVRFCEAGGCECIILACTHFPYIKDSLQALTSFPVIDPADTMYDLLMK